MWDYQPDARLSRIHCQVVFHNHAGHLVIKALGLLWQQVGVHVHNRPTCYVVWGGWLGGSMLIQPCDGGEPPLTVLEGEGELGCWLTPPRLGVGAFSWPAPLK